MKRGPRFTIYHGLAASLALHSALGFAAVLPSVAPPSEEPSTVLVIHLQGAVAEIQAEQKVLGQQVQQEQAATAQPVQAAAAAPPAEPPREQLAMADTGITAPPVQPREASPSRVAETTQPSAAASSIGTEVKQYAQTIEIDRDKEADRLRDYIRAMSKKVQTNLVYPSGARRAGLIGIATVSFTITSNGAIRPETLRIVKSSGQSILDASALQTIRASTPFGPPPREMTVAIEVAFGRNTKDPASVGH